MNRPAWVLGLILVVFAATVWTFWPRKAQEVGVAAPLPPAKEVRTVEKVIYKPEFIYVYPDKSKNGLGLPKSLSDDPSKKLIATGKLEAEEREYTLSGVFDTQTGHTEIHARPDPLPWLSYGKRGAVGVAYGLRDDGQMITRVYASHDLLQVKALRAGVGGTMDMDGKYFAGGYIEYRF